MNPDLQISKDAMGPSIMDGDTNYIYSAWGPYTNSINSIAKFVESHNVVGYKSICDDGNGGRWIIIQSTNTAYIAQGPFGFDIDQMVTNEDNWIIGVILGQDNRSVEIKGLGKPYFDFLGVGQFWVLSKLHDSNEGQSICMSPTIPSSCNIVAVEGGIDLTFGPHVLEVKGHISEDLVEEDVDTMLLEIGTLCEGKNNKKIVEPKSEHLVDFLGDGTNLGETYGDEELAPLMPILCLEIGHGNHISKLEQDGVHLRDGESQSLGSFPNDLDTSLDDVFAMFGDLLENNQAPKLGPHGWVDYISDGVDCGATIVPTNHEVVDTKMEVGGNINGNEGMASMMQVHSGETLEDIPVQFERHSHVGASHYELEGQQMVEETIVSTPNLGDNNQPIRKRPWMEEPLCCRLVEVNNDMMEATPIFEPIVGDGEVWTMPKKVRVAKPPSPRSVLRLNALKNSLSPNEVDSIEITGSSNNGNEDMVFSTLCGLMETLESDVLQPLLDQGTSLSTKFQWVSSLGNVEDISKDEEIEGQMVEGTVATNNTSLEGCKSSKKRPRHCQFKQHGVKRREGGRESFVAYFRPKDLPKSNKTFLTIGEFSNERDAWNAFNLFAFVHEGEESCINMVDRDSIEMDAMVWGELPRVDLVAHLRLKGRGHFKSDVLPSDSSIPRYRNIKFRKNTRGIDKGRIRWFCDLPLAEGVTDPCVGNGTKDTSTYETAEEAAKEADRLSMLNEGHMAWTNYTITDYMTEVEKDQWDPMWIPLQDNPKKYLSTAKYNSVD